MANAPTTPPRNFDIYQYKKKLGDPFKVVGLRLKKQIGQRLGTPYLSGAEAKHHLVSKLKEYTKLSYSKQQIIKRLKKEYGLKEDIAKATGNYLIPEKTGLSKEQIKTNIKGYRASARLSGVASMRRLVSGSGNARKDIGKNRKEEILNKHKPAGMRNEGGAASAIKTTKKPTAGTNLNVKKIAETSELEVKIAPLQVEKIKGKGVAVSPEEAVSSVDQLNQTSTDGTTEKEKTGGTPHIDLAVK